MAKIMLVEDDNNLREIYEARLLAEGYEIVSAEDGEQALALAVKEKPDLIISDVMMPKISGFNMLDILRSTPETRNTKVIMMTALSQAEDKARANKLGADRYLVKSQVTLEDVAKVARDGLFEIGGHTLTHPPLPSVSPAQSRREIEGGKRRCEELTGREVSGFAYPHGAVDDDCRAAVRESGFAWACTTATGPVQRSSDPHALPRLFVQDWDAATFEAAVR